MREENPSRLLLSTGAASAWAQTIIHGREVIGSNDLEVAAA
jgi:hypothetical protein